MSVRNLTKTSKGSVSASSTTQRPLNLLSCRECPLIVWSARTIRRRQWWAKQPKQPLLHSNCCQIVISWCQHQQEWGISTSMRNVEDSTPGTSFGIRLMKYLVFVWNRSRKFLLSLNVRLLLFINNINISQPPPKYFNDLSKTYIPSTLVTRNTWTRNDITCIQELTFCAP